MPVPKEITTILLEAGLPTAALALAAGLIRWAGILERQASEQALAYVSGLLTARRLDEFGRLAATLVPLAFDKLFGTKIISVRFVFRSFLLTTGFWLLLLEIKHPNWKYALSPINDYRSYPGILLWYTLDMACLVKSKILLTRLSQRNAIVYAVSFYFLDLISSYLLSFTFTTILFYYNTLAYPQWHGNYSEVVENYVNFYPIFRDYIFAPAEAIRLDSVGVPSTMLTFVWTLAFVFFLFIAKILISLDAIARFTAWWFRDFDKHPLTAVAKVAGASIVLFTMAFKAIHWAELGLTG